MAQAVAAIVIKAAGASLSTGAAAAITAAAAVTDIAIAASYQKKQEADARKSAASAPRDVMVRSAIEPSKIVYGRARVSGPVVYTNTAPTTGTNDNNTLWTVVSLAGHECDDIEAIYLDGDKIPSSIIDWAGTGGVTSGTYGPISGNEVTNFYRRLGSDSQTHVTQLASAFSDWTADHDGRGICYLVSAFELGTRTGEGVWANGAPQNIRAVVKGKKVYDPRKDSTNGGSGSHRLADPSTWEWSDNPALCLADYLFDADLGMGAEGIAYSDIDWAMVATAADQCDATVTVPSGGSTKRFTCNGALDTGTAYADNIRALLSSMAGTLTWSGGKYRIRACAYEAPTYTFTENDIVGDVQIQPERPRAQRFNTVRGTFVDPNKDYAATQFLRVQDSDYLSTRDDGQELTTSIALPMTNDEFMAQRLAYKSLRLNNQQTTAVLPVNWKALKVGVGERISVTIAELGWSAKVFVVDAWSFDPEKGFMLTVREDSASAYTDPALGDYSTRTAAGTIVFNEPAVPSPSGLTATSEEEGILLEWEAPSMPSMYDEVVVYASADSAWANAVEVGRVRGTRFRHELTQGTTRYYWVRSEDVDGRESIRDPDSDTSTVTATAGQISTSQLDDDADFALTADWPNVSDSAGTRPVNNATNNGVTIDENGNVVGAVETSASGKIYSGKSTYGSSTAGWLLEKTSGGVARLDIGDGTNYVRWDGSTLAISGGFTVTSAQVTSALGYTPYDAANPDSFIDGSQVNSNVTSISGGAITTGTVAAARIDVSGVITAGSLIVSGDNISSLSNNAGYVDSSGAAAAAPVQSVAGATGNVPVSTIISAGSIVVTGDNVSALTNDSGFINGGQVNSNVTSISGGVITTGTVLAARLDVAGIISAGGIIVGGDNITSLTNNAGYVDSSGAAAAAPVQSVAGATGNVPVSTIITAGSIVVSGDNVSSLTNDSGFINGGQVNANVTSISGGAITTGTVAANRIDVSGVISAGGIIVSGDNISSLTNNAGYIDGSQVNSNVTSISGGVITTGTVNADRISIDGITLSRSGGNLIIKNGGVDTTQIQVNAVTQEEVDFNSSTSATSILNNLSSGYNLSNIKASVTITTEGGPVDLFSSFEWAASAFYTNTYTAIQMWLYRKTGGVATLIYSTYNPYIHKSMGAQIGIAYVDTPAAGTYTYELHLGRPVSYTVYGRFPYIRALELKR